MSITVDARATNGNASHLEQGVLLSRVLWDRDRSNNCKPTPEDQGGLLVGDFDTQYVPPPDLLTNSTIRFSAGYGIVAMWLTGAINVPNLTATNAFSGNAQCAQTFNATFSGCPSMGCTAP